MGPKIPAAMQLLPPPRKGKADWREYRAFKLDNGVTCMAVHDKESKTTAVAAAVNAGAAADPRELSGLAHFAEHMCFLGSEKYPGENEYKKYLSSHGGRSNGSTSLHLTTYQFDVLAEHAETAVDIFSHFFTCPLFTASGTSREVNAVDSENSKNLTADVRRRLQILKALADPNHYYSKFTTGNSITLPADQDVDGIRDALLAFHRHHYHPENLTVVIVGPQSLDTLQDWLVPRFSTMTTRTSDEPTDADAIIAASCQGHAPLCTRPAASSLQSSLFSRTTGWHVARSLDDTTGPVHAQACSKLSHAIHPLFPRPMSHSSSGPLVGTRGTGQSFRYPTK